MTHEQDVRCSGCEGTGRDVRRAPINALYAYIKARKPEILPVCEECGGRGVKSVTVWSTDDEMVLV